MPSLVEGIKNVRDIARVTDIWGDWAENDPIAVKGVIGVVLE